MGEISLTSLVPPICQTLGQFHTPFRIQTGTKGPYHAAQHSLRPQTAKLFLFGGHQRLGLLLDLGVNMKGSG